MNRRMHACRLIMATCLSLLTSSVVRGAAPQLRFERSGSGYGVSVALDGRAVLTSPPEGLWSIATDWKDGWPTDWVHAGPAEMQQVGDWTILTGKLNTKSGTWLLRDAYRLEGDLVQCVRRFTWQGEDTAKRTTLSVRFQCPGKGAGVLLPGILYHGNPSGAKSGRVPVYEGRSGEIAFFEEHRFPMPYASIEWPDSSGRTGAALHSLPSPAPFGHRPDQWWSLGLTARDDGTELALLSGPCASNGRKSVVKATQNGFLPYDHAYLDIPAGAIIEKTFYLQVYSVDSEGSGFQHPTRTSLELFTPYSLEGMPTFPEIIRSKYGFARTRWLETETAAGFKKYPDRDFFVLGWCGQAAACGYAFQALADELNDPNALPMAQKSLDFASTTEFHDQGFCTWYNADERQWVRGGNPELLSQGQAMLNVANAIRQGRNNGLDVTRWGAFLRRACDFHAERILSDAWRPVSTNEAFFIAPLCQAYRLFGVEEYRDAAVKAGRVYASRHVNMREPYWGGTLDASCEDKEGAFAALQGFLALYELTGESKYLTWAAHAGDVALTYVVVWDIDLPAGRLRDHGFKTRGWTAVSVQNQHIDVFGVLIAPDIYRLGRHLDRDELQKTALLMVRSCGQLIDPFGSQGEQPHHTNYAQHGDFRRQLEAGDITGVRGNYVEQWTVFWITAHFLNAAAQFKEMGVPIW
ncbi:hypothetical protein [Anaerobaca lacustris]|uniref:Cellulase Ig-like domain-containing protein n=1 Tax=Anaerobaca lacustris TaxID=3044600 RepID=A0AAW6U1F3_9BACT|nr:hypothetical protein [Sedimentisphaerales bacterium M17dextr]